jgi:Protein of unknown function (DUF3892)
MGTFSITEVHLERAPGATHDHIARVRLLNHPERDYSRAEIIYAIRAGDVFYTYAIPPALVYVHPCPHCLASDYITTHPDSTPTNNLLDLPKY